MNEFCVVCKKEIDEKGRKRNKKYCSKKCANENIKEKYKKLNPINWGVSPGTVGAINELIVAIDLMKKKYDVFRCLSPNSNFDLAVIYKDKIYKIEVTTGVNALNGKILYPPKDKNKFDILAIATKCGKIIYDPALPI